MKYDDIINDFKLPICYDKNKIINNHVFNDIEIIKIYNNLYDISNVSIDDLSFKKKFIENESLYYSTNKKYLMKTQKIIKQNSKTDINVIKSQQNDLNEFINFYTEFKNCENFDKVYLFIEWDHLKFINKNKLIMHFLSLYNILSPTLSLLIPIIICLLPFFILKIKRIPITIDQYTKLLKLMLGNQPIVKIMTEFKNLEWDKRIYMLISVIFYFFQIYQSCLCCIKFYNNIYKIIEINKIIHNYINNSITVFEKFNNDIRNIKEYNSFRNENKLIIEKLNNYKNNINNILNTKVNFSLFTNIGDLMTKFYNLYYSTDIEKILNYSICLNQYIINISTLGFKVSQKYINKCNYTNNKNNTNMTNMFYPLLKENLIYNDISTNKNIIITGPNASGKTTLLKSMIINNIISQTYGFGFYSNAKVFIYDSFYSYLNIPDTSERDSLFQSEARRCKEILNNINKNKTKQNLVIFDELYSGTNYYEAISGGYAYIKHLNKKSNIRFLLTTHYIKICKLLNNESNILNMKMIVQKNNSDIKYLYKCENGISDIKGGLNIFKQFNYDKDIIEDANNLINEL